MSLTNGEKPKVANVPNGGVGAIAASSNVVTLGSNTNGATIYTAAATYGGRVMSLIASTDDTVTVNVYLYILNGATVKPLGLVNIPLSSGNTQAAKLVVDFLDGVAIPGLPIDNAGKRYIPLMGGEVLKCGSLAGLTAAKTCFVTAIGMDYQA